MSFQKSGMPEEGELVLCTVTNIQPNSVFVNIDDYQRSAMIHISEISPGRIRNIRDYVKEGKKIVCMVLRIHKDKGYIDLSLRRVNETQKKKKIEYIKQQQRAEKIVEFVAEKKGKQKEAVLTDITNAISKEYADLVLFFNDVATDVVPISNFPISKDYIQFLEEIIRQRIKPPSVLVEGDMSILSYAPNGVEVIKKSFASVDTSAIKICYLGGGKYHLSLEAGSYKEAEDVLDPIVLQITKALEAADAEVTFKRIEKKK